MRLDRIGGILVIAGWGLVIVTGLIFAIGGSFAPGTGSVGGTVLAAGLATLASGVGAIAVGAPRLLRGRAMRIGLGLFGIGLACAATGALLGGTAARGLEGIATIVLLFVGGWIGVIGAIVTVVGLLRTPGRPRTVGWVFLGGFCLCLASAVIAYGLGAPAFGTLVAAVGGVVVVGAGIGVGLLAIGRRDDPSVVAA